jgi:Flp pilus assembly protein TadB
MTVVDMPNVVTTADASPKGASNAGTRAPARARTREEKSVAPKIPAWATRAARTVLDDAHTSWVWTGSPPSLSTVRRYDAANVPGDHPLLRAVSRTWKYLVAIPVTATAYTVAWLLQHPLRALPALLIVGITLLIWIG